MKHWHLSGSTALVLLLSAKASLAVTPEEVWANWQAALTSSGSVIEAAPPVRNGDTLEATGVKITFSTPDEPSTISTVFDKITFRDRGDGSVEVTMPSVYPFTLTDINDGPGSFTVRMDQKAMSIIASGTAEATNYDISADEYTLTATEFTERNGVDPVDLMVKATITGMVARYAIAPGQGTTAMETTASAASTVIELAVKDPETTMDGKLNISIGQTDASTKGVLVGQELMADMSKALKAGFMVDSTTTIGPITVKGDFTERNDSGKIDASLSGASARIALDPSRVDYGFGLTGANVVVASSELPVPEIQTAFGELSFNFMLPIAMSDTPQDYSAVVKLVDLTAADVLWSMVDPAGQLLRDPMTFILDLKGTGRWTADIMDPAIQSQAAPPMELNTLDVPQILFKALGGEINATGGFTFDNTDLMTFGGFPAPTGKLVANLKGINGLIDTAVAMGFVPEDQVMAARMGLAMFAKPGAGPDELISEIEFKDKGLFVNGQQLQ